MDYLAVADAIAARYAPALVTPPTVNGVQLRNIVLATARVPNAVIQSPSVIVLATKGDLVYEGGTRYDRTAEYLVNFYYAKSEADLPRESAALVAWLGVLLGQLEGQTKLGLGGSGVMKALVTAWQIGALTYAGIVYDGITITVKIWTETAVGLVA